MASGPGALIGAFTTVAGGLKAHDLENEAQEFNTFARAKRRQIRTVQAIQSRRAFIRNARVAITEERTAAVSSGAGLDSSSFLGSTASLITQGIRGLEEEKRVRQANEDALGADDNAARKIGDARSTSQASATIGNIFSGF